MRLTCPYTAEVVLSPGRWADDSLQTCRGTGVSVQNQQLDVFGVVFVPQLWQMSDWTWDKRCWDKRCQQFASFMLVSGGQLTDLATGE